MSWIFLLCQYLLCCHRVHRPRKVLYSHCSTLVNTLTLAIPHSFHMLSLFLQKLPFNYQVLCGSYLYISKKLLLVSQSFANLPNFRLPAPIDENFERLVMHCLYKPRIPAFINIYRLKLPLFLKTINNSLTIQQATHVSFKNKTNIKPWRWGRFE